MGGSVLDRYLAEIGAMTVPDRDEVRRLCTAIEAGVLAEERLASTVDRPQLVAELREIGRAGRTAFDEFVSRNLKLVVVIAREMAGDSRSALEDLVQAGNLGLIRAVQGYDWRRGFAFSTYARWWIRKAVAHELALSRAIWIPEEPLRRLRDLARTESVLGERLARAPTVREIAEGAGTTVAEIVELRAIGGRPASLDQVIDTASDLTLVDLIPDERGDIADLLHDDEVARALEAALRDLDPVTSRVLSTRYGLDGGSPRTVRRAARELHLSVADVESAERSAIRVIAARVRSRRDDGLDRSAGVPGDPSADDVTDPRRTAEGTPASRPEPAPRRGFRRSGRASSALAPR